MLILLFQNLIQLPLQFRPIRSTILRLLIPVVNALKDFFLLAVFAVAGRIGAVAVRKSMDLSSAIAQQMKLLLCPGILLRDFRSLQHGR